MSGLCQGEHSGHVTFQAHINKEEANCCDDYFGHDWLCHCMFSQDSNRQRLHLSVSPNVHLPILPLMLSRASHHHLPSRAACLCLLLHVGSTVVLQPVHAYLQACFSSQLFSARLQCSDVHCLPVPCLTCRAARPHMPSTPSMPVCTKVHTTIAAVLDTDAVSVGACGIMDFAWTCARVACIVGFQSPVARDPRPGI
jgi:hypothetical protein